jgi:hypothetical protein
MEKKFICEFCNKNYKSYQSLWNHKNKFHQSNINQNKPNIHFQDVSNKPSLSQNKPDIEIKNTCKFCSKEFVFPQSKWKHEQKCKITEIDLLKKENENLKNELLKKENDSENRLKAEIDNLKKLVTDLINKQCKMHPKTLQKIKNNGIINNTNNTINIMSLGNENLGDLINESKKIFILNKRYDALRYIIELVHFNPDFPQFHNVIVTNNRTNEAHTYDEKTKTFKIVKKDELVTDLIEYRICDIEEFYLEHEDKLNEKTKYIIKKFIDDRGDSERIHEDIKLLLFNNKSRVKNLLTNGE